MSSIFSFSICFYKMDHKSETASDWFKASNTNIKPAVGDKVKIDNEIYNVRNVLIDYDNDNIHVFVD